MHPHEPGKPARDPSDSVLLTLARAAMASGTAAGAVSWPRLDLDDPAQRIFGDYELVEEISRGGMGVVYRARQRSLDRDVAVKFVAAGIDDEAGVARFLAEARAAARLVHPNIVPVHEVGSVDGLYYFSMPLIRGRTLADTLAAGKLPPEATVALLLSMCDAIDYAHRLGLLHLDLKPANVMLDERDQPQVADFGLARHMDERGGVDAQEVSGTPSFMAPEQILIRQYRLTPATDIYALGAILYRCLAGVSPHGEGQPDDVIRRAAAGRIRPPRSLDPSVPRDLDAICMKCLELQPADRYPNVAALADDLRRVRDGQPVSVRRIGAFERAQRWRRREPRLAAATAAAVVALVAGAAATTWQWREAVARETDAAIASEIGAHLLTYDADEYEERRVDDLLDWLRERLPGDEAGQAASLARFAGSVDDQQRNSAEGLLFAVIRKLGTRYRQDAIASLQASEGPDRQLYSALLAWSDDDATVRRRFPEYLKAAIDANPSDPFSWSVAALFCPEDGAGAHCLYPDAAARLARLDPGNMYAWLLVALDAPDHAAMRAAVHQAARRDRFDDYFGKTVARYPRAIAAAGVPVPPLIARPADILSPREDPAVIMAYLSTGPIPLAGWQPLMRLCDADGDARRQAPLDAGLRADCSTIGAKMMAAPGSAISQMVGVAIVRNTSPGTPLAEEALHRRKLYLYLRDGYAALGAGTRLHYPIRRFTRDLQEVGEISAMQRRAIALGLPGTPPADWAPDSPLDLLSSKERLESALALNASGRRLVASSRFDEADALLAPEESSMRRRWRGNWILVRYLTELGMARTGRGDFAQAKSALDEAWEIAGDYGPGSSVVREAADGLLRLHVAWAAAEPGHGHEASADEWRAVLARFDAGNRP